MPREQRRDEQADDARAHHQHALANERSRIPQDVHRGFHVRGEHGAMVGHAIRHGRDHGGRDNEAVLVRVQEKTRFPSSASGPSSTMPTAL